MPVQRVVAATWETQIARAIASRDLLADSTMGPIRDIIARPVSVVADAQNANIVQLSNILSLTNVALFANADMDNFAYNFQILRGPGGFATTVVSLLASSPPTQDVPIPINFPFSTQPDPTTGAVTFFAATQAVTYAVANANNFYDATTRMYRLDVPVQATTSGVAGNVGPGAITQAQRSIGGFQQITNFLGTGNTGTNAESNQDVANTILIFNLGVNDISTPYGIGLETQRQFPIVTEYQVVYGSDPLLTRASIDAGATDLYLVGSAATSQADAFTYAGVPLVLSKQPGISIISVISGATTYNAGVDYVFTPDTGPYGGSIQGQDAVVFLPTALQVPVIGSTIVVTYNYNALIGTIQNFFNTPQFEVDGRSLLYKQAFAVPTSVAGILTVLPHFDANIVAANVLSAIGVYINGLGLGVALEQFGLLSYLGTQIGAAGGIDNFVLTQLNFQGIVGVLASVPATEAQYLTITSDQIVIT